MMRDDGDGKRREFLREFQILKMFHASVPDPAGAENDVSATETLSRRGSPLSQSTNPPIPSLSDSF